MQGAPQSHPERAKYATQRAMRPRNAPICAPWLVRTGWEKACVTGCTGVCDPKFDLSPKTNMQETDSNISRTVEAINTRGSEFSLVFISFLLRELIRAGSEAPRANQAKE
jgi:hypothetical protein